MAIWQVLLLVPRLFVVKTNQLANFDDFSGMCTFVEEFTDYDSVVVFSAVARASKSSYLSSNC